MTDSRLEVSVGPRRRQRTRRFSERSARRDRPADLLYSALRQRGGGGPRVRLVAFPARGRDRLSWHLILIAVFCYSTLAHDRIASQAERRKNGCRVRSTDGTGQTGCRQATQPKRSRQPETS